MVFSNSCRCLCSLEKSRHLKNTEIGLVAKFVTKVKTNLKMIILKIVTSFLNFYVILLCARKYGIVISVSICSYHGCITRIYSKKYGILMLCCEKSSKQISYTSRSFQAFRKLISNSNQFRICLVKKRSELHTRLNFDPRGC